MKCAHALWNENRSDIGDEMDWNSGIEKVRSRIETEVWSSIEIGIGFGNEWINHNDRIEDVPMEMLQLTFPSRRNVGLYRSVTMVTRRRLPSKLDCVTLMCENYFCPGETVKSKKSDLASIHFPLCHLPHGAAWLFHRATGCFVFCVPSVLGISLILIVV